jgi:hypothetical protein
MRARLCSASLPKPTVNAISSADVRSTAAILRGSNCPASAKFVMCMIYAPTVILTVYSGNIAEIQADRRRCAFVSRAYP